MGCISFQTCAPAAIEWLNQLAPEKVWFYAVEVHAIKIGDSLAALDFRPVAVPKPESTDGRREGWQIGMREPTREKALAPLGPM